MWAANVLVPLIACVFFQGSGALEWASSYPADGSAQYVCSGSTVNFPFAYNTNASTESVSVIRWLLKNGEESEMIAIFSYHHFIPMGKNAGRVKAVGNAGISLSGVTVGDTGNVTVELEGRDATGVSVLLHRTVALHVSDSLMTRDGKLHVVQSPKVILDPSTGQLTSQLLCGDFVYAEQPPFDVQWTTPKKEALESSDYSDGSFSLLLKNPVQEGSYQCLVPPDHICGNGNHSKDGVGSMSVSSTETRFLLMEEENRRLRAQIDNIEADHNKTKQVLERLKSRVAFTAQLSNGASYSSSGTKIIWDTVVLNEGNGYDRYTGIFTAPVSGDYMFAVSTRSSNSGSADSDIMAQTGTSGTSTVLVCRLDSHAGNDAGACIGIAHLFRGRQAWVQSFTLSGASSYSNEYANTFAGFLISPDL